MMIRYIAFYDTDPQTSLRNISPAAVNKIDYIVSSIEKLDLKVEIISPTWIIKKGRQRNVQQNATKTRIRYAPLLGYDGPLSGLLNIIYINAWLFFHLLKIVKRDEKLVVYHSLAIIPSIIAIKIIKSLRLILEVEEIYTDVGKWNFIAKWIERFYIKKVGSYYLLSTELLGDFIPESKPRIVIYGSYFSAGVTKVRPVDKKLIRLLYAGIIDAEKKGAFNALNAAKYLSEHYAIHIVGFGDLEKLKSEITKSNLVNKCKVFYDGFMSGLEFDKYCAGFDVGLSTQSLAGDYLASSFPSKILTYLLRGMRVVSPHIDCVACSSIGHMISYYYEDEPCEIAEAISSINFDDNFNSVEELKNLDQDFVAKLEYFFPDL